MQRILTRKHDSCRHQLQTTLTDHTLNHQSIDLISFKSLVQSEVYIANMDNIIIHVNIHEPRVYVSSLHFSFVIHKNKF